MICLQLQSEISIHFCVCWSLKCTSCWTACTCDPYCVRLCVTHPIVHQPQAHTIREFPQQLQTNPAFLALVRTQQIYSLHACSLGR